MDTIGKPPGPPWARWVRKQAEDDSEVVLEKSLMNEIADTLINKEVDIDGSEQLNDDEDTSEDLDNQLTLS